MHIVITANSLRKGGLEKATIDLARSFKECGYETTLVLFNNNIVQDCTGFNNIIIVSSELNYNIEAALQKINRENPIDVIFHTRSSVQTPWIDNTFYIIHTVISERLKRKNIASYWKHIYQTRNNLKNKHIITVSNSVKDDLINNIKIQAASINVIPNLYNKNTIINLAYNTSDCEYFSEYTQQNYLLSVGNLIKIKRHDLLIDAFNEIKNKEIKLLIIGDGEEKNNLEKQISKYNLQDRIIFIDWTCNPYPWIKAAKATIVSSDSESLSSVIIESLILQTPVITTDCTGPVEVLPNNYPYIANRGDSHSLAKAIDLFLSDDLKQAEVLNDRYQHDNVIQQYIDLLPKTLESKTYNSSNKKVAFLLGSLNGAGAEKTILTLAHAIARQGAEVNLFLLNNQGDYQAGENISLIAVDGDTQEDKQNSLHTLTQQGHYNLFITSRAEFYDHIVAEQKYCSVHITPTAWIRNPKWQKWKITRKTNKLKDKFKNKKLIALSHGIHDDLVNNLECISSNIKIINNPFDINEINSQAKIQGDIPDYPYIVYVASFIKRKRHEDLLNAFSRIEDKKIKLVLLGKGKLEKKIEKLAVSLGVADRVVFWGWDINPYRMIKNSKLSILASEAEGLPRVLVESLILKTPIVSTDCPSGPNEVLIDDLAEFLVPVGSVAEMTLAINKALDNYPEIDDEMLAKFSSDEVAKRYVALMK